MVNWWKKWEKAFAESEDVLDKLADETLAEHAEGETKPMLWYNRLLAELLKEIQKQAREAYA